MSKPNWGWAIYWAFVGMLNLWVFLAGFVSGDIVSMVGAIFVAFFYPALFLTSVKSDHVVKRALEVIFMLIAFGAVIYGYVVTRSFILGVFTVFVVTIVFVAFTLSYLLPRIRS